jgi:monothiol glutaredoxin
MTQSNTEKVIREQIATSPVILYMKGTPDAPECGFSGATVSALKKTGIAFSYVNVLANPFIRERLPSISRWPTFPQLFVSGELIGGCDIVLGMEADGSLNPLLQSATTSA